MKFFLVSIGVLLGSCNAAGLASRGTVKDETCHFESCTQKVDHSAQNNEYFSQPYSLITDHYKPGGPIFYYQGSELYELDCVVSTNDARMDELQLRRTNDRTIPLSRAGPRSSMEQHWCSSTATSGLASLSAWPTLWTTSMRFSTSHSIISCKTSSTSWTACART
jgi:hypothetical protein